MGSHYDHLLKFFVYGHLPEHLQAVSKPFAELADKIVQDAAERPVMGGVNFQIELGLQRLLEAKDCIVRSMVS